MMAFVALMTSGKVAPTSFMVCETTVSVLPDGRDVENPTIVIELQPAWSPTGVKRVEEMVRSGFFTDLPFFRAIPNFLIQFGIAADEKRHREWAAKGNIADDPPPHEGVKFEDGIVSFAEG